MATTDGKAGLKVDFSNAFNCVDRSVVIKELRTSFPELAPFVEWCYANPSELYYEDDIIWSERGV